MKKYLVVGNPIEHSLSPALHNYWIKKNNIDAIYDKQKIEEEELKDLVLQVKEKKINGFNVTVPFKKTIIPHLDELSEEATETQSVNTVYLNGNKTIGHNTDIEGFELSIRDSKFNVNNKEILILGAGGVVSSIIFTLFKMKASQITVSNRSKEKAESLKKVFNNLKIIDWGEITNFDMIINATSVGLKKDDRLKLDFSGMGNNKFFYDVIYNPKETDFLIKGKKLNNKTQNGKKMFIYQALAAFKIWHGIQPNIDEKVLEILNDD
tara:strand:- start:1973 stop:2770 length:798 start_codon:yes stop_codon:yes gene_type:complete